MIYVLYDNSLGLNDNSIIKFSSKELYDEYHKILKFNKNICPFDPKKYDYYAYVPNKLVHFILALDIERDVTGSYIVQLRIGLNKNKFYTIDSHYKNDIGFITKFLLNKYKVKFITAILHKDDSKTIKLFLDNKYVLDKDETFNERRFEMIKPEEVLLIYYKELK